MNTTNPSAQALLTSVPESLAVSNDDITRIKADAEAARQQAQFAENLLESVPAGIAVMNAVRNPDGRLTNFQVVRVNSVLQELFCLSPAQVLGRPLSVAFAFAGASGLLSRCMASIELGETQAFEMPFGSQEKRGWYRVSMAPQGDQVILAVMDISDRRRAQLAQHEQAELLQSVLQASPDSIVAVDAVFDDAGVVNDFVYVMMNRAGEETINRRLEDIRGKGMLEVFPANRETGLFDMYRQVWETGQPQQTETRYEADGVTGWFRLSIVRRGPGLLITVTNTTGLNQIRRLAEQQADTFNAVLHSIKHGMTVFRVVRDETGQLADLQYEHVGEQVVQDTGLSRQQFIGSTILTLFPETKQSPFWQAYIQVLETGKDQQFEHHHHHEGYDHHVIFQVARIDENRLVSTYQIINELKRQQHALEVLNMELRQSNDNLQQFAYVASHDLQEPLRKIQSFGDILATNYADVLDETGLNMIGRMQKAAERMSGLIRDLLNYSRVSTERNPFAPVSLTGLLTSLIDSLSVAVQESGAGIDWDDLPEIMGDRTQLNQLFQNLLSNAIKFRLPGVPPRVSITHRVLSSADLPSSVVGTARAVPTTDDGKTIDQFYEINVADNGIGFDEKYLDRIFQVFQRLHGKNVYAGTGVGLAICRKVVENHRGAITASSQPGAGTTFRVYLPVQTESLAVNL